MRYSLLNPSLFVNIKCEKYNALFQPSSVIKYICFGGKTGWFPSGSEVVKIEPKDAADD